MYLSLLPLVFSLILTVASRLFHPYTINEKLLVNGERIHHREGYLGRSTELHGEEKMEEGNRGDQEEKRRDQKEGEQASQ